MSDRSHSIMFPSTSQRPDSARARYRNISRRTTAPALSTLPWLQVTPSKRYRCLRRQGVEFLRVPDEYYEMLPAQVGRIDEPLDAIKELGILVDRDDEGC